MIGNNNAIYFSRVIELERHIEILLLDNDCVIVPDLGGFMSHYIEARYDDRENLYLPPLRTLGFNPKLTMNDSLLAQSYVEAYDISFPEAISRIEKEVSELHQHLENEGYYELYDIGTLRLNGEGNYEFEPCEAGILTPSLYGLNTLEIDKIVPVAPIAEPLRQPAHLRDYKEGGSYDFYVEAEGKRFMIRPSFNYIEGQMDGYKADVLFLGVAGLQKADAAGRHRYS